MGMEESDERTSPRDLAQLQDQLYFFLDSKVYRIADDFIHPGGKEV